MRAAAPRGGPLLLLLLFLLPLLPDVLSSISGAESFTSARVDLLLLESRVARGPTRCDEWREDLLEVDPLPLLQLEAALEVEDIEDELDKDEERRRC